MLKIWTIEYVLGDDPEFQNKLYVSKNSLILGESRITHKNIYKVDQHQMNTRALTLLEDKIDDNRTKGKEVNNFQVNK
jgi:hypothetical protein